MSDLPMADRPEIVLPEAASDLKEALEAALFAEDDEAEREALSALVAADPTYLDGWAALATVARDDVERYAYARVGYHRGLDALRSNGWGGVGRVRWDHPSNRGFLRCLAQLRAAAQKIGEQEEVVRIGGMLVELDPDWDDSLVARG